MNRTNPEISSELLRILGPIAVIVALLAVPAVALAHANLARSEPQANANLESAPAQVRLWFSERPEARLAEVVVFNQRRERVDQGRPAPAPDDSLSLVQPLQPGLAMGAYTVSWRVTSAVDGHVTAGAFAFGVGETPPAAILPPRAGPSPQSMALRWLSYLSVVGLFGLALFPSLVLRPAFAGAGDLSASRRRQTERVARGCRLAGMIFASLAVAAAATMLLDQTLRSTGHLTDDDLVTTLGTPLGRLLVGRGLLDLVILGVLWFGARRPDAGATGQDAGGAGKHRQDVYASGGSWRAALGALVLTELLLFAMSSHAAAVTRAPELALFIDWLHLALASVWVGGLIALAIAAVPTSGGWTRPSGDLEADDVERNRFFGPLIARFSRIALGATIGLALTGLYQAWIEVGDLDSLISTDYGWTLLAKTAIFGLALLLAGFHRLVLKPPLSNPSRAGATRARRFFSRTLPVEAVLGVAILAATGVLTSLPPANAESEGGLSLTRSVGGLRVVLQVQPGRVGANLFQVTLRSAGKPVSDAEKVELRFDMLDMNMGESALELRNQGQGVYAGQTNVLGMGGRWRIETLIRLPGQLDQRTSFDVNVRG